MYILLKLLLYCLHSTVYTVFAYEYTNHIIFENHDKNKYLNTFGIFEFIVSNMGWLTLRRSVYNV